MTDQKTFRPIHDTIGAIVVAVTLTVALATCGPTDQPDCRDNHSGVEECHVLTQQEAQDLHDSFANDTTDGGDISL